LTYLVDGYNLILTTRFGEMEMERAREYLVAFGKVYAPDRVIIVFDGKGGGGSPRPGVVFTREGESADDYMKRFIRNCEKPQELTVVTEDREITGFAGNLGAGVMSTREFVKGPRRLRPRRGSPGLSEKKRSEINEELREDWGIEDR